MKPSKLLLSFLLASAMALLAQQQSPPQASSRGWAWGDKNRDGICDVTGQPVGQRAIQAAQQQGRSRPGRAFAWGDRDRDGICDYTGQPVGQRALRAGWRGPAGRWGARAVVRGRWRQGFASAGSASPPVASPKQPTAPQGGAEGQPAQ